TYLRCRFAIHVRHGEHLVFVIDDPTRNWMGRRLVVVPERGVPLPVFLLITAGDASALAPASEGAVVADAPLRAAGIGAAKPAETPRTLTGRVSDPGGRPLAGIRLAFDAGPK